MSQLTFILAPVFHHYLRISRATAAGSRLRLITTPQYRKCRCYSIAAVAFSSCPHTKLVRQRSVLELKEQAQPCYLPASLYLSVARNRSVSTCRNFCKEAETRIGAQASSKSSSLSLCCDGYSNSSGPQRISDLKSEFSTLSHKERRGSRREEDFRVPPAQEQGLGATAGARTKDTTSITREQS